MIFKNAISWFEIPAVDLSRAQKFYETIFDIQMVSLDMPQLQMRMFPIESPMNMAERFATAAIFISLRLKAARWCILMPILMYKKY